MQAPKAKHYALSREASGLKIQMEQGRSAVNEPKNL